MKRKGDHYETCLDALRNSFHACHEPGRRNNFFPCYACLRRLFESYDFKPESYIADRDFQERKRGYPDSPYLRTIVRNFVSSALGW
jgi:hypothetical protein